MNYIYLLVFSLSFFICQGQTPVLVKDLNPGSTGNGNQSFYPSIQIGNIIYFITAFSGSRDIYAVNNGEVNFIGTTCQSDCSAFKDAFIQYNGKLIFRKRLSGGFDQLWESDGTESGNKLLFEYKGTFKTYTIGNNNKLYINLYNSSTFKDEVYMLDSIDSSIEKLNSNSVSIFNTVPYKNGFAFANVTNDSLKLFRYDDKKEILIGKIKVKSGSFVTDIQTLNINDFIILVHSDNASVSELYRFKDSSKQLLKELSLPFVRQQYPFLKYYNQDSLILYHIEGGHFIISGDPLTKVNLSNYAMPSFSFIKNYYYKHEKNAAYLAVEADGEFGWKFKVIIYDGDIQNSKEIEIKSVDGSGWVTDQNYIYYTSNSPSFISSQFYYFDIEKKSSKIFFEINQNFSTGGIRPLGIVENKLYFLGNLNQSYGRELYYIETGISTSTEDITPDSQKEFTVHQSGSQFSITCATDDIRNLHLSFFDTAGRLLKVQDIFTDTEYRFDDTLKGLIFLQITDKQSTVTQGQKLFIP